MVVIAKKSTAPARVDHPPLLDPVTLAGAPTDVQPLAAPQGYRWEPEKSPEGPVSIIVSGYDKRIIVMRNGVEIGRSAITLIDPETPLGTHAFVKAEDKNVVTSNDAGGSPTSSWIGVGITGYMDQTNRLPDPDPDAIKRIHVPDAFIHELTPVLHVGSTLMITDEPVLESTTGMQLAVLSSSPEDLSGAPK